MCVTSAIFDYGRQQVPPYEWTRPAFDEFKELVRKAEEFDRLANQPDCVRDGGCRGCGTVDNLHVHHLTYERLGRELLTDLVTLCAGCHRKQHGR